MPEIGRPVDPQAQAYRQVTMAPKALSSRAGGDARKTEEELINRATGRKPEGIHKDGPHNQMGKDEFLKLLTYQLQNQDPLNPVDQSKMTGELAQFSQLEQLSNLNSKFDAVQKNQMVQDKFYAANFVGKRVVTAGSSLKLEEEGGDANVLFKLGGEAAKVLIRIQDEKGQTVGEIWKDGMSSGSHEITWNGTTLDNQLAAKGNYKATVKAWDKLGAEVPTMTQAQGLVTSVTFDQGEPVLSVDGQKVFLRDVVSFHHGDHSAAMQNVPSAQQQQNALRLNQAPATPAAHAHQAYRAEGEGIYD